MSTVVTPTKDEGETIAYSLEFLSRLQLGETLQTCAAAMSVLSGTDPTPATMLSGVCSISGTSVLQSVTGGIPGNIYKLALSVRTSLNNIFVQETAIAILPSDAVTPP